MFLFVKQKIENIDIYYNYALNLKFVKWNKTKKKGKHIYMKITVQNNVNRSSWILPKYTKP